MKSAVFHYEFDFIHPFVDGNGRVARLWQTVMLSKCKRTLKNWYYCPNFWRNLVIIVAHTALLAFV
ncbi:hypothetical protein EAI89_11360 [Eubacterium sp. am_0171]|uniref:Fic family protein n=1 Tax=Eubacterium sp. SB2 TaxID=1658112 RepID=UPI0009E206E4|nr:Fic family protein [Clostridium sp.]MSC84379.1 hypothetical protein [Eubacterium sp. BIOML-A1]MSD06770.1 hypothetical protein [Eubacterium sp. BIOML-A2]RYT18134.1 hypothetical protein EAI89_11360 [Eubacterium sp. am_0171]